MTSNEITTATLAGIDNSDVDATAGGVSIHANAGSTIDANTLAAALSVAAGSGTVTLAGAVSGAVAFNTIGGSTEALIEGDSTVDAAGSVDVAVLDSAEINSNVMAASVAVSASSGSVAGSLAASVSLAQNTIEGTSRASIDASDVTATGGSGDVSVSALTDDQITAVAAAAAVSVAASTSVGVSIAGAGAWAKNVTTNEIEASIVNGSTVDAAGSLDVLAVDSSSITSLLVAASTSVAVGSTGAVGVGMALALAENEIGGTTVATIADSTTTAGGEVSVLANDGGILDLSLNPWASGNSALVVDGARRYADLKEPDQVVDLKAADPWSSGTTTLGGVTLDGNVAVDTTTDSIALGTMVDLYGSANLVHRQQLAHDQYGSQGRPYWTTPSRSMRATTS